MAVFRGVPRGVLARFQTARAVVARLRGAHQAIVAFAPLRRGRGEFGRRQGFLLLALGPPGRLLAARALGPLLVRLLRRFLGILYIAIVQELCRSFYAAVVLEI